MNDVEQKIRAIFEEFSDALPRFDDGRVNYSGAKRALVVTAPVVCRDEVLLLRRSDEVETYKGHWSVTAGYLDAPKPVSAQVRQEMEEELGVADAGRLVERLLVGEPFSRVDAKLGVDWVTVPVLVLVNKKLTPKLNWEHTAWQWIKLTRLGEFELVPGMADTIHKALALSR